MNQSKSSWRQTVISCTKGYEDIVSAIAFEAGCMGIVEETTADGINLVASWDPNLIPDPMPRMRSDIAELCGRTGSIPARFVDISDIPWQDWETNWRKDLTAIETGNTFVVRPSWVPYNNTSNRIEIIIDPRMAFGTGHHATTALCLEALETIPVAGKRVIDAGIGSGVLSIAVAKLGASEVHGFDHDEWSVANARDNAIVNDVSDLITIDHARLDSWDAQPADIILANMISGSLLPNMPIFAKLAKPDSRAIFSGILAEEEAVFTEAAIHVGFTIDTTTHRDEWIAVYVSMPA